jgi:hypothetical protein
LLDVLGLCRAGRSTGNHRFARDRRGFVTDRSSSFALRELRTHLGAPFVLAMQAGIAVLLAISGPFGTLDRLATLPRLAYWVGIVFGTYAIGSALTLVLLERIDSGSHWPVALKVLRGGIIIGLGVVVFLWLWNLPFFGWQGLFGQVMLTGIPVSFGVSWIVLGLRAAYPDTMTSPGADLPALLKRLPIEKRGALIALCATDHYVEVITENGRELVLMRLADAIAETAPTRGMQVHRSHWIALAQVRGVERRGEGALLDMGGGLEIPVSRRHLPTIRAAGLLPQKQG